VPSIKFGFPFVGGEINFFGVDYYYVVSTVGVGAVGWFVFSFEEGGDGVGEAADGLGGGVD